MSAVASTSSARVSRTKKASLKPSSSTAPLGKFLASSEKPVRDKAVASLSRFLAGTKKAHGNDDELTVGDLDWNSDYTLDSRLAPNEMEKLWKGVFFCFWMSDKPLVQQALAVDLALLTLDVRPKIKDARSNGRVARFHSAMSYLRGFWDAIVREWSGLDRLRLDKFYLLIRRFIHAGFLLLKREQWDPRAIDLYNDLLTGPGGPLHVSDPKILPSLGYHLADIYVEELDRALTSPLVPSTSIALPSTAPLPLIALLQPLLTTFAIAPTTTLSTRLVENAFEPLFRASLPPPVVPAGKRRKVEAATEEGKKGEFVGLLGEAKEEREAKGKEVLKALFDEGGKGETGEVQRRRIYKLVGEWEE